MTSGLCGVAPYPANQGFVYVADLLKSGRDLRLPVDPCGSMNADEDSRRQR